MKKRFYLGFIGIFLFVLSLVNVYNNLNRKVNADDVEVEVSAAVMQQLFDEFYNNGYYIKETVINMDLSDKAVYDEVVEYFHAASTILNRTTIYKGDALWMSRDLTEKVEYSYYGTAYNGEEAVGVTNGTATDLLVEPVSVSTVLSGEGKTSMEAYYKTLDDLRTNNALTWKFNENTRVYTYVPADDYTSDEVINIFKEFTAPCFLNFNEENEYYLVFTKATVEVVDYKLVLKLYVSAENTGCFAEDVAVDADGNVLFSQATVSMVDDWDGVAVSDSLVGNGTEENPYLISSGADLAYFASQVNAGTTYAGVYFKLTKSINLDNNENFMIGNSETNSFAGVFDGNSNSILGLYIDRTATRSGLFYDLLAGGEINNLSTYGSITGGQYTGGIVGYLQLNQYN